MAEKTALIQNNLLSDLKGLKQINSYTNLRNRKEIENKFQFLIKSKNMKWIQEQ